MDAFEGEPGLSADGITRRSAAGGLRRRDIAAGDASSSAPASATAGPDGQYRTPVDGTSEIAATSAGKANG